MRRKVVVIAVALLLAVGGATFAQNTFGIGAAFSLDAIGSLPQQALLSLKVPQVPILWGIGVEVNEGDFNMGLTADWWFYQTNLTGPLNFYLAAGVYAALPETFEVGGRIPLGLNIFPLPVAEIFLEFAPTLLIVSDREGVDIPDFGLQAALGFRFWFN